MTAGDSAPAPEVFAEMVREIRRFVREQVVPLETQIDEQDEIPERIRRQARELGLFGTNNGIAGHVLMLGGTDTQKRELIPQLASGELTAAFARTEPEAGSSPADLTTTARPDGEHWVLDGTKRYITNAPLADLFMVFARSTPGSRGADGISAFVVPAGTPGLTVGPRDHKMGQQGAWTADVILDGVRVGSEALVGDTAGRGYRTALGCLANGRLHIAALCVGLAARLVDESLAWATERRQGGKPIAEHQLGSTRAPARFSSW